MLQDSTSVDTVASSGVEAKVAERALELLEKMAQELGTTVDYLWEVLIRQAYVEAAETVLVLGIAGFGWFVVSKAFNKAKQAFSKDSKEGWELVASVVGIVSLILTVIGLTEFTSLPTKLLNPDYWALQHLLETVRGGG